MLRIPYDVWYFSQLNSSCVQMNSDMSEILVGDVLFRRYVVLFDLTMPHKVMLGFGLRNLSYVLGTSHAVVTKHAVTKRSAEGAGVPPDYPGPPIATDTVVIQNKRNTQCAHPPRPPSSSPRSTCVLSPPNCNIFPGISSTYPSALPRSPSESSSTPDPPYSASSASATLPLPPALLPASARLVFRRRQRCPCPARPGCSSGSRCACQSSRCVRTASFLLRLSGCNSPADWGVCACRIPGAARRRGLQRAGGRMTRLQACDGLGWGNV